MKTTTSAIVKANIRPPDVKSQFTGKDPAAGKDRRQKKRVAEDRVVRHHH